MSGCFQRAGAACDPRQATARGQPRYQRKSSITSIGVKFRKYLVQRVNSFGRWWRVIHAYHRCSYPTLAYRVGEKRIPKHSASLWLWRREFSDNPVPVRHQNGLSLGRQAHIFAQAAVQGFDSNGSHAEKVATSSYLVKFACWFMTCETGSGHPRLLAGGRGMASPLRNWPRVGSP